MKRLCFLLAISIAASATARTTLIPKWSRFEQSFGSSVRYDNPLRQCELKVTFVSPRGESNVVFGFWDGGTTWRVRFSPDLPGPWTYRTECSDPANKRLNNQTGEFLCTSIFGRDRFAQHGPIRVALDHHHFEHADGSAFFWLADAAWHAPLLSETRDWLTYTQVRARQQFSAVQWAAVSGVDSQKRSAFTLESKLTIDPQYFQALDEKIEMMNRVGLLSVIAPLWGNDDATSKLSDDQAVVLVRYMVARWGAYDISWLLAADNNRAGLWHRVGRKVFGTIAHAPVIIFPGERSADVDAFRNENWVDAFGFGIGQSVNDDSVKWLVAGPLASEWNKSPARPVISVLPPLENRLDAQTGQRISAEDVRRVAWWSLLVAPTAGTSYGAQDVAHWNTSVQSKYPTWQLSLFLPGAKQMGILTELLNSTDYWSLRPATQAVATQPGTVSPRRHIAAVQSEDKNLQLTYVPEDRTLELYMEALGSSPGIQWLNPRTGQKSPAVAVVGSRACQLPTPEPGDWVLVVKNGK